MDKADSISQPFSWIEISEQATVDNIRIFRNICTEEKSLGVVLKSNAYGHGLREMLAIVHKNVDIIFLSDPLDGKIVRNFEKENNLPSKRVVILSAVTLKDLIDLSSDNIEFTIYGNEWETLLNSYKKMRQNNILSLHLHVDTGLGREGFSSKNITKETSFLNKFKDIIQIKGFMSHFSNTEDVTDQDYADKQLKAFNESYKELLTNKIIDEKTEKHFSASAASLILKKSRLDTIRVGISLYGLWPSDKTKVSCRVLQKDFPKLSPVMSWHARSQTIKNLQPGDYIGYGCTYKCETDTTIAVLPIGYFDGYPRLLSNKAHVLVDGKRCPILGRVMMNHIIINISSIKNSENGITATLLGKNGNELITAEMLGDWAETINYEAVTTIGSHIKRIIS